MSTCDLRGHFLSWDLLSNRLPCRPHSQKKYISRLISSRLRTALNALDCIELKWTELNGIKLNLLGLEWTGVPLNLPSIEMNRTQRAYRPVLPAADKQRAVYLCVCVCVWLALLGLLLLNVTHFQCDKPFGRCRPSDVSALSVKQLSREWWLYVRENRTDTEKEQTVAVSVSTMPSYSMVM